MEEIRNQMKDAANKGSAKTSPRNAGGGSAAEAVQRELKTLARHTEQVRRELHACRDMSLAPHIHNMMVL